MTHTESGGPKIKPNEEVKKAKNRQPVYQNCTLIGSWTAIILKHVTKNCATDELLSQQRTQGLAFHHTQWSIHDVYLYCPHYWQKNDNHSHPVYHTSTAAECQGPYELCQHKTAYLSEFSTCRMALRPPLSGMRGHENIRQNFSSTLQTHCSWNKWFSAQQEVKIFWTSASRTTCNTSTISRWRQQFFRTTT